MNHFTTAEKIAKLLDNEFKIFGFRFGLDPILGLVPGLGDIITAIFGGYLIWIGYQMGIPSHQILRMVGNLAFDFIVGSIPIFGDVSDFVFKANSRNLEILRKHRVILKT